MSTFGRVYRVTTFGESHSSNVGCVIDGFPANIQIDQKYIQEQLDRRRPGQSKLTTPRKEDDRVRFLSGLNTKGITLGSPITMIVDNQNIKPGDYSEMDNVPRPGHADYTYIQKYNIKAESGGGRSSARETVGRVCAGALAQSFLKGLGINFNAWVSSVGNISIPQELQENLHSKPPSQSQIDEYGTFLVGDGVYLHQASKMKFPEDSADGPYTEMVNIRCPHPPTAYKMIKLIEEVRADQDSIGGVVTCCITGVPAGLGEPCFDKLPALLAHAMLSIPATKGFEFGSGFEGTKLRGSKHNDVFVQNGSEIKPKTNHAGGTLGGISSGENIYFKVAFKPVSTIGKDQITASFDGKEVLLQAKGRHDPCVLPRAPPIVESMAALVIMDLFLLQTQQSITKFTEQVATGFE